MKDFLTILGALDNLSVLVVGDLMLDHFIYGQATRLSPESPVPVLNKTHALQMLGGAGNVLSNLRGLTVRVHCLSVCGDDTPAQQVKALLTQSGVDPSGVVTDPSRPTTQKTRFVAGQHQLLRMDEEKIIPLSPAVESQLLSKMESLISSMRAVVISDYGKGVVTPTLTRAVIELAQARKIPVFVDPKSKDYALYAKADVLTPNKKEISEAFGQDGLSTDGQITAAARTLMALHAIKAMVVTRSEDGLSVVEQTDTLHDPVQARSVFDVSGAGDTVIACLAAFVAAGASLKDAARLANIAGGIVVGKSGTAPITLDELKGRVCKRPPDGNTAKRA